MSNRLKIGALALASAGLALSSIGSAGPRATAEENYSSGAKPNCYNVRLMCAEVANPKEAFGNAYIGHDEPATTFYSNWKGSGNNSQYKLTIPSEPAPPYSNAKSYNFELHPAFWFGMAMCDTQSYPEQKGSCTPDSDGNIVDPATSTARAPGAAFEELQFYPPGWVPQFADSSCDATKWCVALNIDSLAEDPINGTTLNSTCQSEILGGIEYINFAYLTLSGSPIGPPNPLQFDVNASGDPQHKSDVFFMNAGDQVTVTLKDSANGLVTTVADATSGQTGTMTASAANHFGQIKYDPSGTSCVEQDYTFHPMYSTSTPQTRVLWAAHSYNVSFSDEIGHFDFCGHLNADDGYNCDGKEGPPGSQEPADGDDVGCFPSEASLKYKATGCVGTNDPGFDGASYYASRWPDGSTNTPTPITFSSPKTGATYGDAYRSMGFETDLPRVEAPDLGGACDRSTGNGCTNPPPNDDGNPVFYPYFSEVSTNFGGGSTCGWAIGSTQANTLNDFGGSSSSEYGPLLQLDYYAFGGHGSTVQRYNDYRQIVSNPCP